MTKPGELIVVQEWEGYVVEIRRNDFVARLLDISGQAIREEEEATIPYDQISDADRANMCLGSIFRWVIGYEPATDRNKHAVSRIEFRYLPPLTQSELDEAWAWAVETRRLLGLR